MSKIRHEDTKQNIDLLISPVC